MSSALQKASEDKARLDRIDVVIRDDAADTKTSGTVADTLNNPIVTQLRTRYLELVNREANWSRKYGANHLAVVNLRNQIRDVRGSILDELKRLRESYLSNYEIAKQQAQDLEKRLTEAVSQSQTTNQAQVALRELESSAQSYRTMHDNFLQRYTESLQQQSFPISDARIIAAASPPLSKSGPKTALILVMAAAGGLVLGVAAGIGPGTDERFSLYQHSGRECVANVLYFARAVIGKREATGAPRRQVFASRSMFGRQLRWPEDYFSRSQTYFGP